MSRNRFFQILCCARFDDKSSRDQRRESDKLAPIREVFEKSEASFRLAYVPTEYITVC
jgi:hypothetical protein